MKPVEKCSACRFWLYAGKDEIDDDTEGSCRRRAPVARSVIASYASDLIGQIAWAQYRAAGIEPDLTEVWKPSEHENRQEWPVTNSYDWCGEYEPMK
jgi:hypothetical protein